MLGGPPIVSTIDWHGKISMVFHFAGCNLRCKFCHNEQLFNLRDGIEYTQEDIREFMEEGVGVVEAVVFTGGEPTMQGFACQNMAHMAKQLGYEVMIDTNGLKWEYLVDMYHKELLDKLALDVKCSFSSESFKNVTGRDRGVKAVKSALQISKWIPSEIRVTMWPGIDIVHIINDVEKYVSELHLQHYNHKDAWYSEWRTPGMTPEELLIVGKLARLAGIPHVYVKSKQGITKIE